MNVPYLAMSARVSSDSRDRLPRRDAHAVRRHGGRAGRARHAAARRPAERQRDPAQAYLGAAILFAILGTAILMLVGASYREQVVPTRPAPVDRREPGEPGRQPRLRR